MKALQITKVHTFYDTKDVIQRYGNVEGLWK